MWHQYWSQWHHVIPNGSGNCITWPKSHATSHFYFLDLKNVMVTSSILIESCDANTSANGMSWQEKSCCTLFLSSWPKECYDAIGIKWHWHQWHYMTKKSFFTSFWPYGHEECSGAIASAICIMWCWWCSQCRMTSAMCGSHYKCHYYFWSYLRVYRLILHIYAIDFCI